ncbi:PEP-CTERM sorting domain-containing protein [Massilia sp. P8910]|uniref:PEP-CTERM sorting domain-containing protein n=1 Tax=Massilia antarctica TaxID=2765360 RepID=UPI001E2ADFEB|nr:PEP-CTERM sorting domain-containing protein [Massilia antarctica]MCE3608122.1 PEP-CTERM sorting domain-containing protein [Massilia antarctica]
MKPQIAALILGLTLSSFAQAEVVMFDFTATVAKVTKDHGAPEPGPGYMVNGALMNAGYTLRGTLSIDLNTYLAGGSSQGNYSYAFYESDTGGSNNAVSFSVDQSRYAYSAGARPNTSYGVFDQSAGTGEDQFSARILNHTKSVNGTLLTAESIGFYFGQADGKMLGGHDADGLPLLPGAINFAGLSSAKLEYGFADYTSVPGSTQIHDSYLVSANLTSFALHSTSPVPEPSAYLMLAAGVLVLGAATRRRRSQGAKR